MLKRSTNPIQNKRKYETSRLVLSIQIQIYAIQDDSLLNTKSLLKFTAMISFVINCS